jgi:translation initiation factor IF-2
LKDYCQSIGIKVGKKSGSEFQKIIQEYLAEIGENNQLIERQPIISIMGHIDHGKTTLLDNIIHYCNIRQRSFQSQEAGGITQKITVSQVEFLDKKITFLDTPGHSDFTGMRQRVISLTDLIVLVIDARDGIMPRTEEIINYLHEYKLPVIVFVNHKKFSETNNETNLNRIRSQLQERDLTPAE